MAANGCEGMSVMMWLAYFSFPLMQWDLNALPRFDCGTLQSVEEVLVGAVSKERWAQATLGVDVGGLSLRGSSMVGLLVTASPAQLRPGCW